jgi:predicted TIM-barrel fold metal-dependent hydrolase
MSVNGIIDFHTHVFPDDIAERAMRTLVEEGKKKHDVNAYLDGRLTSLLASMDRNGIEKSIVCSIATKPSQFGPILAWSGKIMSDRVHPFPSLHPDDRDFSDHISIIRDKGFRGIKFHPYYQDFRLDDERLFPLYEKISERKLIVVMHTGFDLAFERRRLCDPEKIVRVLEKFPDLKMVTTHLGAWEDWDEVEKHIVGREIYMEISYALDMLDREKARRIILNHPKEFVLFGTDSPWTDQARTLALLKGLDLGQEREDLILRENALDLLDSV